jgi:phage shock protein PspC (stress-responsive transcriptional regulator)
MRSSRERMWAGVAGGMAEYFEIDPSLMRLLWVAAAVVTGGLAVPAYILLWIILPRDDRSGAWRDWSDEFHAETRRMADEARKVADEMREAAQGWRAPGPTSSASTAPPPDQPTATQEWWQSERYVDRPRNHGRHPRSTGIVLVVLGALLLAANWGVFNWIQWRTMWPLIFIGLGLILLAKQTGWGR